MGIKHSSSPSKQIRNLQNQKEMHKHSNYLKNNTPRIYDALLTENEFDTPTNMSFISIKDRKFGPKMPKTGVNNI